MKTFKSYCFHKELHPDEPAFELRTLDDIQNDPNHDEVHVSPDADLVVVVRKKKAQHKKKRPNANKHRIESFSVKLSRIYFDKYLKPQL